jgi:anti-sigma factor RsiW
METVTMRAEEQKRQIERYLLGQMSAPEREEFEARYLADDELFAAVAAAEDAMIHSYLDGTQSEPERALFVSRLLNKPGTQKRMEFAQSLREYLGSEYFTSGRRGIEGSSSSAQHLTGKMDSAPGGLGLWPAFRFSPQSMRILVAALSVLVIALAVGLAAAGIRLSHQIRSMSAEQQNLERKSQELQKQLKATTAELEREYTSQDTEAEKKKALPPGQGVPLIVLSHGLERGGAGEEKPWVIPNDAPQIDLRMKLPLDNYASYSVTLETAGGEPVWEQENLDARLVSNDQYILVVTVPTKMLRNRTYVVSVTGKTTAGEEEIVAAYVFRTIRKH